MNLPARKPHPFGLLHRYGGISSAIAVIIICITGLLLNHTEDLQLDEQTVSSQWLLEWYGIKTPKPAGFSHQGITATQLDRTIYLQTKPLPGDYPTLRGIINFDGFIIVATGNSLILLTPDGRLIETLETLHGIPATIVRIGLSTNQRVILDTGSELLSGNDSLDQWVIASTDAAEWSVSGLPSREQLEQISAQYRGTGLSLERIILDLHSGRIFGSAGVWVADAAALLFIMLAMTGIWMWFKTRRRKT